LESPRALLQKPDKKLAVQKCNSFEIFKNLKPHICARICTRCEKFVQSTSLGDRLESSLLELYPKTLGQALQAE